MKRCEKNNEEEKELRQEKVEACETKCEKKEFELKRVAAKEEAKLVDDSKEIGKLLEATLETSKKYKD